MGKLHCVQVLRNFLCTYLNRVSWQEYCYSYIMDAELKHKEAKARYLKKYWGILVLLV